ncbi:elongation factor G [endosymbiont GvMRE of Glomus versiforme]|uniref:elongation factor G n=1 Tax=endosymbiont GvMRE of Glomus versiforme TaxID=2039283 RepID=UPI000EDF14A3|nr:elongation factor G [endosymbiont GvMRE of Glomus versiforme]RHZ37281.1 Elongation factor G [endosymbiont GvMRE of Glomus versiforme]
MLEKNNDYLSKIRNIGIMAHIDAGKTTTTERILYHTKKIRIIREVHDKSSGGATMDYMEQEKERGITITSAATTVFWQKHQINIIDTPGHVDFTAEVERSLRVLDGGIVVIDGKEGVEAQTETVWNQADKYQIPRLVFINKMDGVDHVENRFTACCQSLEERLYAKLLICQFPIGEYQGIKGIIDLIEEKTYYFSGEQEENYQVKEIPINLREKVQNYRQNLLEKIVTYDEKLGLKYLEGKLLTAQEIKSLIRKAVLSGEQFAVFCGSAYKHVGVKLLLDGVIDYLPSPLDSHQITVISNQEEKVISTFDHPHSLALAFKINNFSFAKLTFIRVYCGKISANSYVYNVSRDKKERVSRLVRMHANKQEEISEIKMGDIAAVIGFNHTKTGDTLCSQEEGVLLEQISFTEPVISLAIEPKSTQDQNKLIKSLQTLEEEDPTFFCHYNTETRQTIIKGMGELHLDVLVERLKSEFGVETKVGKPQVSYRETITKKKENVEGEYVKQTGGSGHYAKVQITFEPNEKGKGFEFIDNKRGQDMSDENAKEVKKGLEEAMLSGLLLGHPLLDMKATLLGGKRHEEDTQPGDFKMAAISAFRGSGIEERRKKAQELGVILLEPIMNLEVSNVSEEYYGAVLASITKRRGTVEGIEKKKETYLLKGKIPLAETFGYSTILRSSTKGRATHYLQFSHYQEVPPYIMEKLKE